MAYEKQNWQTGEVITADKLNHMEDGIEGNVELIKIATFTGGSMVVIQEMSIYAFNGNGALDNSKTLYDFIEDKNLIGFIYKGYGENDVELHRPIMCGITLSPRGGGSSNDPRFYTVEERKNIAGGSVSGIVNGQCNKVDIYAVCI